MNVYEENIQVWNELATAYVEKFMDLPLYNTSYDALCKELPANALVLDAGCGPGNISRYMLGKRPDLQIVLADAAEEMLKQAHLFLPNSSLLQLDLRNLNQLEMQFNAIVCGFCLPYLEPKYADDFIENAWQKLHNDAWLYISFVEGNENQSNYVYGSTGHRVYFWYHQEQHLTEKLIETGFQNLSVYHYPYKKTELQTEMHTVIICKKV